MPVVATHSPHLSPSFVSLICPPHLPPSLTIDISQKCHARALMRATSIRSPAFKQNNDLFFDPASPSLSRESTYLYSVVVHRYVVGSTYIHMVQYMMMMCM